MVNKKSVDQHARLPASIIASDLTLSQFKVYAALSWHKGGNAKCWPKVARLSKMCNMHERNISKTLSELESLGLISREFRNVECQSTMYTIYEPDVQIFEDEEDLNPPAESTTTPPGGFRQDNEQNIKNIETQKKQEPTSIKPKRKIEYHESPELIPDLETFPECYKEAVSSFYKLGAKIRKSADTEEIKTRLKSSFLVAGLADTTTQGSTVPHPMLIKVELYRFSDWHNAHGKISDGLSAWENWCTRIANFKNNRR